MDRVGKGGMGSRRERKYKIEEWGGQGCEWNGKSGEKEWGKGRGKELGGGEGKEMKREGVGRRKCDPLGYPPMLAGLSMLASFSLAKYSALWCIISTLSYIYHRSEAICAFTQRYKVLCKLRNIAFE